MAYPEYLEVKDAKFTKIEVINVSGKPQLHVAGLVFHSALAVKSVDLIPQGKDVKVMVSLSVAKSGSSGRFDFTVELAASDRVVTFGPSNTQIWPLQ